MALVRGSRGSPVFPTTRPRPNSRVTRGHLDHSPALSAPVLAAIGGDFAAFAKQNEVVHAIPMLDDIQTPSYKLRPFTSFSSAFRLVLPV
jgi:hypothetical protein